MATIVAVSGQRVNGKTMTASYVVPLGGKELLLLLLSLSLYSTGCRIQLRVIVSMVQIKDLY